MFNARKSFTDRRWCKLEMEAGRDAAQPGTPSRRVPQSLMATASHANLKGENIVLSARNIQRLY